MDRLWKRICRAFRVRGETSSLPSTPLALQSPPEPKDIEPAGSGFSDFEATVIQGFEIGNFKISVGMASARGTAHFEMSEARQDSMTAFRCNDALIIGLSDGVSSSVKSEFASRLVTQELPEIFKQVFNSKQVTEYSEYFAINQELSRKIVARHISDEKKLGRGPNADVSVLRQTAGAAYAATLELIILKPGTSQDLLEIHYVRVAGDGGLFEISDRNLRPIQIPSELRGDFGVNALPVCDLEAEGTLEICAADSNYLFATDGIADSLDTSREWLGSARELLFANNFTPGGLLDLVMCEPKLTGDDRTFALIKVQKC